MADIRKVTEGQSDICREVLAALPHWFGIAAANENYAKEAAGLPFAAAYEDTRIIGCIALKRHFDTTTEIYVLGVKPDWHRKGVGRRLVAWAEDQARAEGHALLSVKTLSPSDPDEGYRRTRAFYAGIGFQLVEEFPDLWDADNPSVLMVKPLLITKN